MEHKKVKKLLFALTGAIGIALLPLNAHATSTATDARGNCYIEVAAGESATINYDTNGCYIVNNGNLTIASGANIVKKSRGDNFAAVNNNGTLNISGGHIEAYYGFGVFHNAGKLTVTGGTINVPLHQVIWAKAGTSTNITGGTFKSAIGGEEAIYTLGTLSICGGSFNAKTRSNLGKTVETAACPKPEPTPVAPAANTPAAQPVKESTKPTVVATKATTTTTAAQPAPAVQPESTKPTETATDEKTEESTPDTKPEAKTKKTEEQPNNRNDIILIITAAAIVLVNAGVAIYASHKKH